MRSSTRRTLIAASAALVKRSSGRLIHHTASHVPDWFPKCFLPRTLTGLMLTNKPRAFETAQS